MVSSSALEKLERSGRAALKPPEDLTVSQWAEKHLTLSPKITQFSGRFSYDRTPYLREIVDNINDPKVDLVTFAKAAQVGGTQGLLSVGIAYAIDQDPGPAMIVFPSAVGGKEYSEERLQPMIDDCPRLRSHKLPDRDKFRKSTMYFDRMNLAIVGAGSPASLASRPVRYLFCDEIDKYKLKTNKEGNPLELADRRTRTFWNKKRFRISTPTTPDGPVWQSFLEGDQRYYHVPCLECGHMQKLCWDQLKWAQEARIDGASWDLNEVAETTHYECEKCQAPIRDKHKSKMLLKGEWVPTAKSRSHKSYQLSALYPSWVSFADMSTMFLQSHRYREKLREFVNQSLGEPWDDRAGSSTAEKILEHKSDYPEATTPKMPVACIITADVQENSYYYVIRAWGTNGISWLVKYGQVPTLEMLDSISCRTFTTLDGHQFVVGAKLIDSGYRTREVYQFCNQYRWMPLKGSDSTAMPNSIRWSDNNEVWCNRLLVINSDRFKDTLSSYIQRENESESAWLLHSATDYGYARQMVSESQIEERDKLGRMRLKWRQYDRYNHFWDCEVYQVAAISSLNINFSFDPYAKPVEVEQEEVKRRDGRGYWDR